MDENRAMTPELEEALKQWAKEALEGIGVIEGRHADFDKMAEKVIAQLRSTYTDTTIDMFLRTADNRKIDAPDGFARVAGSCGDTMDFF